MEILVSFLVGVIIGSAIACYILQKSQQQKTIREYEAQIQLLQQEHQQSIKEARNRSIDGSRAVIKGKIAEQLAPVLPNFKYLPSDARFMGDPVDYVVFNGYTDLKDSNAESNLEVVILDIKAGQASLSKFQEAIAQAVNAGRVRFEVVRADTFEPLNSQNKSVRPVLQKTYNVTEIQKTHARAYKLWSQSEDERLKQRYKQGITINNLAVEFHRQPGGVRSRLKKLGLIQ